MDLSRIGDLEIVHDYEWQRKSWRYQRVGWVVLFVFLISAGIGLFGGDGPLREARAGGETSVSYDRFTRFGSPTELEVLPAPTAIRNGELEVAIDSAYWRDFEVDSVTPEPDSVRAAAGEITYTFLSGPDPEAVSFSVAPQESGIQKARLRAGSGPVVEFTQVVYP